MGWAIFIGVVGAIWLLAWVNRNLSDLRGKAKKYVSLKPQLDNLDNYKNQLEQKESQLTEKVQAMETITKEKTLGFPWLSSAFADYTYLQDMKKADHLKYKPHPAPKAAEQVREIASRRRVAEQLYRVMKYQLEYYENLFPWLVEFKGEDVDDLIRQLAGATEGAVLEPEEPDDQAKKWLTQAEYQTLSTVERNQRALDRYWQKPKSKWEIGRDYERYVGYKYESRGCAVYYQGIVEGLADMGRDLVVLEGDSIEIVQCKYWSQEKTIHEKHVCQLYGTMIAYRIDHPGTKVSGCFVTSTKLSDRARQFARQLEIKVAEGHPLERYPCIKCNVSLRDRAKIYHLPFDQQYDRTLIKEELNERYVETVAEAEKLGFRRAFRWHGPAPETNSVA